MMNGRSLILHVSLELSLICKPTYITEVSYLFTVKQSEVVRMQPVADVITECVPAVSVIFIVKV